MAQTNSSPLPIGGFFEWSKAQGWWTITGVQGNKVIISRPKGNRVETRQIDRALFDEIYKSAQARRRTKSPAKSILSLTNSIASSSSDTQFRIDGYDGSGKGRYLVTGKINGRQVDHVWVSGMTLETFARDPFAQVAPLSQAIEAVFSESVPTVDQKSSLKTVLSPANQESTQQTQAQAQPPSPSLSWGYSQIPLTRGTQGVSSEISSEVSSTSSAREPAKGTVEVEVTPGTSRANTESISAALELLRSSYAEKKGGVQAVGGTSVSIDASSAGGGASSAPASFGSATAQVKTSIGVGGLAAAFGSRDALLVEANQHVISLHLRADVLQQQAQGATAKATDARRELDGLEARRFQVASSGDARALQGLDQVIQRVRNKLNNAELNANNARTQSVAFRSQADATDQLRDAAARFQSPELLEGLARRILPPPPGSSAVSSAPLDPSTAVRTSKTLGSVSAGKNSSSPSISTGIGAPVGSRANKGISRPPSSSQSFLGRLLGHRGRGIAAGLTLGAGLGGGMGAPRASGQESFLSPPGEGLSDQYSQAMSTTGGGDMSPFALGPGGEFSQSTSPSFQSPDAEEGGVVTGEQTSAQQAQSLRAKEAGMLRTQESLTGPASASSTLGEEEALADFGGMSPKEASRFAAFQRSSAALPGSGSDEEAGDDETLAALGVLQKKKKDQAQEAQMKAARIRADETDLWNIIHGLITQVGWMAGIGRFVLRWIKSAIFGETLLMPGPTRAVKMAMSVGCGCVVLLIFIMFIVLAASIACFNWISLVLFLC